VYPPLQQTNACPDAGTASIVIFLERGKPQVTGKFDRKDPFILMVPLYFGPTSTVSRHVLQLAVTGFTENHTTVINSNTDAEVNQKRCIYIPSGFSLLNFISLPPFLLYDAT
jgi:hypothetical protein